MARKRKPTKMVEWRRGYRKSHLAPAEDVDQALSAIRQANDGNATADVIVASAADKSSVLHPFFTWDDRVAAHEYRLTEARQLTCAVEEVDPDHPSLRGRKYEIDNTRRRSSDNYKPYRAVEDIMSDEVARAELLQRALNDLLAFRRKYRRFQELAIVFREIETVLENVKV